jgi:hypothetical protein
MAESPPALNAAPSPHRPSGPIAAPAELAGSRARLESQDSESPIAQNVQTHQKRERLLSQSEHATTTRREDPAPPGKWVFEDD